MEQTQTHAPLEAERLLKAQQFAEDLIAAFEGILLYHKGYTTMESQALREKTKEMARFCSSMIHIYDKAQTPYWEAVQLRIAEITHEDKLSKLF